LEKLNMLNIELLAAKFVARVRNLGMLHAVSLTVRQAISQGIRPTPVQDEFDIRYGTDTGGSIHLWKYAIESPNAKHGVSHGAISEKHIEVLLAPLPRSASFVDLGCGKGRPLVVAARMGFKPVIGVEFVREFAEVARHNLQKMSVNATVLCTDAATYEFPNGPLVVYLYNPFDATVMSSVAKKVLCHKGDVWVIYVNPRHGDLFESWMERMPLTPLQAKVFSPDSVSVWHRPARSDDSLSPCRPHESLSSNPRHIDRYEDFWKSAD
jgi:SAM-dependent methyltransferase